MNEDETFFNYNKSKEIPFYEDYEDVHHPYKKSKFFSVINESPQLVVQVSKSLNFKKKNEAIITTKIEGENSNDNQILSEEESFTSEAPKDDIYDNDQTRSTCIDADLKENEEEESNFGNNLFNLFETDDFDIRNPNSISYPEDNFFESDDLYLFKYNTEEKQTYNPEISNFLSLKEDLNQQSNLVVKNLHFNERNKGENYKYYRKESNDSNIIFPNENKITPIKLLNRKKKVLSDVFSDSGRTINKSDIRSLKTCSVNYSGVSTCNSTQKSEFSNNRHNEEFTPILTFVYDQRYYEINNKKFYLGKNAFDEINVFDFSAKMIINCLEEALPSHKLFLTKTKDLLKSYLNTDLRLALKADTFSNETKHKVKLKESNIRKKLKLTFNEKLVNLINLLLNIFGSNKLKPFPQLNHSDPHKNNNIELFKTSISELFSSKSSEVRKTVLSLKLTTIVQSFLELDTEVVKFKILSLEILKKVLNMTYGSLFKMYFSSEMYINRIIDKNLSEDCKKIEIFHNEIALKFDDFLSSKGSLCEKSYIFEAKSKDYG